MSIVVESTVQRIQVEKQPVAYRIVTGGQGPAGANGNVGKMYSMTLAEYEALDPPEADALYVIVPAP